MKILKKLISVEDIGIHKVFTFLGIKLKIKSSSLFVRKTEHEIKVLSEHLENIEYEIADKYNLKSDETFIPKIMTIEETLDDIIANHRSVCRFGDGEFRYLLNINGIEKFYFNTLKSDILISRLKEILLNAPKNQYNSLICLWDFWGNLSMFKDTYKRIARCYMHEFRYEIYKYLDKNYSYGNAFISRPYIEYSNNSLAKTYFDKIKNIWQSRDVIIIEGSMSRLGVGNDLFNNANSIQRIICPPENAFEKYNNIYEYSKTLDKNKLILIALGMTATVLAFDLAKLGFQAIDIGHIDIEYEWFLKGCNKVEQIENKYTNDVCNDNKISECKDPEYLSQIIKEIL